MAEERVQRRLAAIVAADVVGYSRMMGRDETGTLARLKALRADFLHPKVAEYGGRIVKTTGDGTLIEFPSAVDAVSHAVEVQRVLAARNQDLPEDRRIELRFGVNLGDIIIDSGDIFGDGVNVAARLEQLADPGGIAISASIHEQVCAKLDVEFDDMGPQTVKNISQPVQVYRVRMAGSGDRAPPTPGIEPMFRRPAVAVLPFENLSGDQEQDYLADGLTEDIITALSLWRTFPVIARNSTFAYKNQSPDIREVGRALGAKYVIEGSVRRAGDRVRVTAQLIEAATGHHLWADRYDRAIADIFDLQDELSEKIASTVAPEIEFSKPPGQHANKAQNLDAWELVTRGFAHIFHFDMDNIMAGRALIEQAIALDPDYARAWFGLAWSYHREMWIHRARASDGSIARMMDAAERAVALDGADSANHSALAMASHWRKDQDRALAAARRAVELNPNDAQANEIFGSSQSIVGEPAKGLPYQERAYTLSPRDPRHGVWFWARAFSHLTARDYETAVDWAQQAIRRHPDPPDAHLVLAAALGHLDRIDEARAAAAAYAKRAPDGGKDPALVWSYKNQADEDHFREGLRKAGLPAYWRP